MDARRLLEHMGELHLLSYRAGPIAEIVSESDRLHSLMVRIGNLTSPLGDERAVFASLRNRSDDLKELIEVTLAKDWNAGNSV